MKHDGVSVSAVGHEAYHDERLDALLSITGRMDGYLYRCRNDQSYTMLYISDGVLTVSGYPPTDFVHNAVRDYVSAIHPDDLAAVYAAVDAALEARRNWNVDYRIVPKVGEPLWVREIGGGVWDDAGELEFLEGFVVDISDRKVVEDLNSQLLQDLKVANEELSAQKREIELAKQQSDHSANHDLLTDLPNRRAFHNELKSVVARCGGNGEAAGLLFIDLDRFKEVNDTLGHEAGDALLQRVSNHLRSILRSDDFVARLGGDEFAFLFSGQADQARQKAVRVAERVLERLRIKVPAPNGDIQVGCTVGVAIYPSEAGDCDALVALADRLMYVGKKSGRDRLVTADALEPAASKHRRTA
ncbi:diguanylate cyclase [Mesorhizobium waimense]|uniref:Diguanylate cyclase n=1 Tax=Mesorhizobium waimense TaxID=1300307 RepID=A0A3A5L053_9HYPH|nr:sensor domain-containing diguanylate cyclase [Mesorhizobium waimense]RJT42685.1 diguanylate cyclase [Mesorhizobium waimense]